MVQSAAEATSDSRTVVFSIAASNYVATDITDLDRPTSYFVVRLSAAPFSTSIVSVDLGGDAEIVFDGFGLPDTGGTIVLQSGNLQRTIVIDGSTGAGVVQ
jgi:hypothetical protein